MNFVIPITLVFCIFGIASGIEHQWHKKLTKRDLSNVFQVTNHDDVGLYNIGKVNEHGRNNDGGYFDKILTIEVAQMKYVIGLKKNKKLIHPNLKAYRHLTDCTYQGRVLAPLNGIVSLSNCGRNGYRGYIRTPEKTLQIDNIPEYATENYLSNQENGLHFVIEKEPSANHMDFEVIRKKRQANLKPRVYGLSLDLHASFTDGVATALSYINDAQSLYLLQSLGQELNIFIMSLRTNLMINGPGVSTYLFRFCLRRQKAVGDGSLLLMGRNALGKATTVGVAIFGYVCRARVLSCGLILNVGSDTDIVIAHELGHTFGMRHDEKSITPCNVKGIMSHSVSLASRTWSNCSIAAYAAQPDQCLMNFPSSSRAFMLDQLYGEVTFEEICDKHLSGSTPVSPSSCTLLTCSNGVSTRNFVPYNGTRCSNDTSVIEVCVSGNCVDIGTVMGPGARKRRSNENSNEELIADCKPHWKTIEEAGCNCETGLQAVHVWCYELCDDCYQVVPDSRCDPGAKPSTTITCTCA